MSGAEVKKKLNHDQDQTLEIPEVITAAAAMFNTINPDHDMTLEAAETKHILTAEEWKQFNADGDRPLEPDERLAIARARFKAADTAGTGKLTAAELDMPAGQSLGPDVCEIVLTRRRRRAAAVRAFLALAAVGGHHTIQPHGPSPDRRSSLRVG
jgi:hypothetical protein